jgi:ABC-type sugar transport system substrate-binding protein
MDIRSKAGRGLTASFVAAALAASVAACGSDDDTSDTASSSKASAASSVVTQAKTKVEPYVAVDKIGPTEPIGKPIPKDKTIVYVNCGQPACTNMSTAFKEAAAVLGWKVEEVEALPTPEKVQAAFDEALRRKPDGIWSAGFGRVLYARQLDEAKRMGIPIMSVTGNEQTGTGGVAFEPLGPEEAAKATAVLADKAIADMGGEGQAGTVLLGGYPIVKTFTEGYENEIKSACPKCSVKRLDIQPTSLGKDAAQKIANFIRANPKMKSLFFSYDLMGSGLPAAAQGAGVKVPKTYSFAPDAPGFQALNSGERTASNLMPYNELSWQIADAFARVFTGGSVAASQPLQKILVVSKDFKNVPPKAEPFPSSVSDYQSQFKSLWGVN